MPARTFDDLVYAAENASAMSARHPVTTIFSGLSLESMAPPFRPGFRTALEAIPVQAIGLGITGMLMPMTITRTSDYALAHADGTAFSSLALLARTIVEQRGR